MNYTLLHSKDYIIKIARIKCGQLIIFNNERKNPLVWILAVIFLVIAYSCNTNDRSKLEIFARNNDNPELEEIIRHYMHEGNKEKADAARYLIDNMKDKYSLQGGILSDYFSVYAKINQLYISGNRDYSILDSIAGRLIDSLKAYRGLVSGKELTRVYDISNIKTDSLIQSIDLAYETWKTKPWASHVNFIQFCEYILPYRIYNEPLQYWRLYLKNKYDIFSDSLHNPKDPKELVRKVNSYLYQEWKHLDNFNECPYLPGVIDIDNYHGGLCEHHYVLLTAVLRSLGVACAIDYTPQWRHWPDKHSWMVILDTTGQMIAFNPGNPEFYYTHMVPLGATGSATKVYRRSYNINDNSLPLKAGGNVIPPEFNIAGIRDVTDEYMFAQSTIDLPISTNLKRLPVFLMAYGYGEQREFVAWSIPKKNKLHFGPLGIPAVYVPVIYTNYKWKDLTKPFIINTKNGKPKFIEPNTEDCETVKLYRKCPVGDSMNVYIDELQGAKFQVSNYADFSEAEEILTIKDRYNWMTTVDVKKGSPYRFIRLISSATGKLNIAELRFYTHKPGGGQLQTRGKVYGHGKLAKGSWNNVLDNDLGTSVSAMEESWLAVDFGQKIFLDSIGILPRNNLNIIIKGEIYELLFFDDQEWHSLGRVIADKDYIEFNNVPSNALLVLKNLSQGKEERIFTYENEIQTFW